MWKWKAASNLQVQSARLFVRCLRHAEPFLTPSFPLCPPSHTRTHAHPTHTLHTLTQVTYSLQIGLTWTSTCA